MKRLIAVGDIHGHSVKLHRLLETVQPEMEDQLVFLGDYVDRGPDSRGVMECLMQLRQQFPHAVFLRGNHEQMLIDALIESGVIQGQRLREQSPVYAAGLDASDRSVFLLNGGKATLESYGIERIEEGLPESHLNFLQDTGLFWECKSFVFVHAGIETGVPVKCQDADYMLWQRYAEPGANGEIHVVGHHPTTNGLPLFEDGRYSLDTGAGYGRSLTACDVLTKKYWQVC